MKPPVIGKPPSDNMNTAIIAAMPGALCARPVMSSTLSPMIPRRRKLMMMPNAPMFISV